MKKCVSCKCEIAEDATICAHCGTSQNQWSRWIGSASNPVTVFVSLISLIISVFALWNSNRAQIALPAIEAQAVNYDEQSFSVLIYNVGAAPSYVRSVDLDIWLVHHNGRHLLEAAFDLSEPLLVNPEQSFPVTFEYQEYVPRWTRWNQSDPPPPAFETSFLYAASGLGNNLHCGLKVGHTRPGYNNHRGVHTTETNGNCVAAIEWFARAIGPLQEGSTARD